MIVKTYLSRAQTRAWSLEHPTGDPTGGPAYREMRAPAVAAIGMATSFSGMMAGSIMAGVAFAGSALSLVGSLTGNKTLSRIGMVAGAIGGAGMAGAFGEAAKGATWGSAFGGAEAAGGSMASQNLSQTAASGVGSQTPVTDGAQTFAVSPPADMVPTPLDIPPAASPGALNSPGAGGLNAPGTGASLNGGGAPAPLGQTPPGPASVPGTGAGDGITPPSPGEPGGLIDSAINAGKGIAGFVKDNPELSKILASGASGLANYLSGVPDAQLDYLQSRTDLSDAQAMQIHEAVELERQRRANLNAGYQQVNQNINVNPDANMLQYQPVGVRGGLIAGAQR